MSAPAAKALSEPVRTMQPMPGSASKASAAARSSSFKVALSAFKACGRLRRMRPTRPRVSTTMVCVLMALLVASLQRPGAAGGARYENLFLAHRAEERRPAGLHDAPDRAAAAPGRAAQAFAVVDPEIMLEQAE